MRNRIRYFRRRKGITGMSQKELAKQTGTFQNVISDYEVLKRPVPEARKRLLAETLGESIETLFPDSDSEV